MRDNCAYLVLCYIIVVGRLNVGNERCTKYLLAGSHRLQCQMIRLENGSYGSVR